ncbi:MAG: adaptor protein MecA [Lachnospiraceae bacterium]|jgi:adapter protein MecA 1/2|nr:adaptor protein MecA [Lachnospiraceae bacterium]
MEYKRIDENTIRCIVTEEDMESFGLNLDEFLSHSGRSDEFLQYIVSEARDELGYQDDKGIVSMRLEVLSDRRISLTFGSGDEKQVREQVLKYLKELAESRIAQEIEKMLGVKHEEPAVTEKKQIRQEAPKKEIREPYRMYCFTSLRDVMSYCRAIGLKQPIKSHLYKEKENYYLIAERYRISDYHFNLLTAVAFDYGKVLVESEHLYDHLREHGELLLSGRAIGTLRKI